MPAKRLTDGFLRTLTWDSAVRTLDRERKARRADGAPPPQPPRQITYIDTLERGLSLVLVMSYGGTKRFRVLTYNDNSQPQSFGLGTYPRMSLKQAKDAAWAYFENPDKFKARTEVGTFKDVAEGWFKRHVEKRGLLSADEIRRQLDKYVYPRWSNTKFLDIRRNNVNDLLDRIEDDSGAAQADAVLATLRGIMTWHQSRHEDYVSPIVKGMRRKQAKARERTLNENEIRRVWEAAGECGTFGALLKFALLTAQRREKITAMRWDDVVDGVWTIRTEEREKGTAGVIRLPQLALDVIAEQANRRLAGNPYVFPGSLRGRRRVSKPGLPTFNSFSKAKAALDAKLQDLPHWTVHDLRRTARSLMSEAGVQSDIAERVLGHAIPGVKGVYDRHHYYEEKADALGRLATLVASIVTPPPDNVVALAASRRAARKRKAAGKAA
jgi:integrase